MNCPNCKCDRCKWERDFIARGFDPTKCVGVPSQLTVWPTTAAPAPPLQYVVRDTPASSNGTGD